MSQMLIRQLAQGMFPRHLKEDIIKKMYFARKKQCASPLHLSLREEKGSVRTVDESWPRGR